MKTIIAGGRGYTLTVEDFATLDRLKADLPITEIFCGCALGVDLAGRDWAVAVGLPVRYFDANWEKFGRSAGPIRNRAMARFGEAAILFPGRRGTRSMMAEAEKHGLKIILPHPIETWPGDPPVIERPAS